MKTIVTIIIFLFITNYNSFSQAIQKESRKPKVWIVKNWANNPPDIKYEYDVYKNLDKSRYYSSFGFADNMKNENIQNGDYVVRFFYDLSESSTVFGTYHLLKVHKNNNIYEFIDAQRGQIFLFTSDYYLNNVILAEENIISWCKKINLIE